MDDASLTYVLDIIKSDDDATADANSLYEAVGPFLVRSRRCASVLQSIMMMLKVVSKESSANNGISVDGLAECRKILKVWPSKATTTRTSKPFELSAPVVIASKEAPKTVPSAAASSACKCGACMKAGGDAGEQCLMKQAEMKSEAKPSSSPEEEDEMAHGEATHLSDVRAHTTEEQSKWGVPFPPSSETLI